MKLLDINSFIHFWSRNKNYIEKRLGKVNLKPAYSHGYLNSSGVFTSVEYESYGCLILKLYENDTYVLRKAAGGAFRVATFSEEPVTGSTPNQNFNNTSPTEIIVSTTPNDKYMVMYFWCSEFDEMTLDEMYNTIEIYCNYKDMSISMVGDGNPIGSGMDYYGTEAPEGYMFADGSAISRTEYSTLFAILGTTYGEGDGSTTFNLPDKRSRVSVMINSSDTNFNALGKKVGTATNTLVAANLPKQTGTIGMHSWGSGSPIHTVSGVFTGSKCDGHYRDGGTANGSAYSQNSVTYSNGGSSQAFSNIQQTLVCNYIIKVKNITQSTDDIILEAIGGKY